MSNDALPTGPDPEAITDFILARFPGTVTAASMGATFFSLDETHWPNFATIVTTDEHDDGAPSNLSARAGAFRLNLGVGKETFERLVGRRTHPDHAAFDTIVPHPVYAKQRWISILNPGNETFRDIVVPLLDEAYSRVAATNARRGRAAETAG